MVVIESISLRSTQKELGLSEKRASMETRQEGEDTDKLKLILQISSH